MIDEDDSTAPSKEQAQVTIATTNYTANADMCLDSLHAGIADRQKEGFLNSTCGMSKIGMWRAPEILIEENKTDPRHILINSVNPVYTTIDMSSSKSRTTILGGVDTSSYPATFPDDAKEPYGEFASENAKS
ncbi:unnamed protein product [Hymenolepis diminuta]|uniref:GMC_oxred_C domain-containing protein n=1 Tax=Hymenolepis diminuta TaxID=6216 RepID=A0A0R3SKN0_HYMDI|nr:unnamed protein product [Hymenolepis diminuta]